MQSPNKSKMGWKNNEEILYRDAYTKPNSENEHWPSERFPMPDNLELTIKKYARPKQNLHFSSKENILWIWE